MNRNTLVILVMLFGFSTMSWAQIQESSYEEPADRETIRERIVERSRDPYVRERETIIQQLEIITGDEETKYIIVPGDTLSISFMDRGTKQESVYQVNGDGMISIPLVGQIKIEGFNRKQAREHLNNLLGQYIRNPQVEIFVNVAGRYMVAGEVGEPGVFRLRSNLTVMEAIMAADYDKDDVNLKSVMVMRGSPDKPMALRLNLHKMVKKGDRTDNILVKPGDFIYVPRRFIANIEKFIETAYRYVEAYYGFGRLPQSPSDDETDDFNVFFR
jgi:polysaccharide export outer membrane protein